MPGDILQFARDWIANSRANRNSETWKKNSWVVGASIDWSANAPEKMLEACLEIVKADLTTSDIARFGCGPLEELLAWNYDKCVASIFEQANVNAALRFALTYVDTTAEHKDDFCNRLKKLLFD